MIKTCRFCLILEHIVTEYRYYVEKYPLHFGQFESLPQNLLGYRREMEFRSWVTPPPPLFFLVFALPSPLPSFVFTMTEKHKMRRIGARRTCCFPPCKPYRTRSCLPLTEILWTSSSTKKCAKEDGHNRSFAIVTISQRASLWPLSLYV